MVVQKWIWQGMAGTAILYSALSHTLRARIVGPLRATPLRLDRDRGSSVGARNEHPIPADEPFVRYSDIAGGFCHRERLRPGIVFVLGWRTVARYAPAVGADRRLDPWLHRHVSVVATEADVRSVDAVLVLRRGHGSSPRPVRVLSGRLDDATFGAGPCLARRQPQSGANRHPVAKPATSALAELEPWGGGGDVDFRASGASGACLARTARRGDPRDLPQRARRTCTARLQRAGGEQERANSACEHLRWAWTVLDLSYPGLCWIGLNSRPGGGRGSRASTGWRRSGRAARLPIATQWRRQRGAHPAAPTGRSRPYTAGNGRCPEKNGSSWC